MVKNVFRKVGISLSIDVSAEYLTLFRWSRVELSTKNRAPGHYHADFSFTDVNMEHDNCISIKFIGDAEQIGMLDCL